MNREREQLSESKKRLRSMEETLGQLMERVGQTADQPAENRRKEIQELESLLRRALEEGIPVEGKEEYRRLRKKLGPVLQGMQTQRAILQQEEKRQEKASEALRSLREEKRKMKRDHSSLLRRLERTAGALESKWWRRVWTGLVGGAVGTLVLAGVAWASMETLPREWRMTPEEIRQAEGLERLETVTSEHLTEEEYEAYRKLLKKAYERDQDSQK